MKTLTRNCSHATLTGLLTLYGRGTCTLTSRRVAIRHLAHTSPRPYVASPIRLPIPFFPLHESSAVPEQVERVLCLSKLSEHVYMPMVLFKNVECAQRTRRVSSRWLELSSVVSWGIAPPSYANIHSARPSEFTQADLRYKPLFSCPKALSLSYATLLVLRHS